MRHPVAWWAWALGLAAAASRGTNPWLCLLLILGPAVAAGARRAPDAPPVLRMFLLIGATALVIRLAGLVLLGSGSGATVLLDLPSARLPLGVTVGGPLTLESLRDVLYSTLQLGAILACFGAASELGPPRRLLPHLPASLYEVGTAIVVALTCAPQVADHARSVHTARRLRSTRPTGRVQEFSRLVPPVLDASLDRSVALAAAMECRGFARTGAQTPARRRLATAGAMAGLVCVISASYGLLTTGTLTPASGTLLLVGVVVLGATLLLSGSSGRTRYRHDPWEWPEWLLVIGGLLAAAGAAWSGAIEPVVMSPPRDQALVWPPLAGCAGVLIAIAAALATPLGRR